MQLFSTFADFNEYIGLKLPTDDNIDVGIYPENTLLKSDEIEIDF